MGEAPHDPLTSRNGASLAIGAIAAQVIGGLVLQLSPFMIGGIMVGLSLSERDAGVIVSVEFLMLAVTAIMVVPILPRLSCRRIGFLAVGLALLAQGASIFSASWTSLVLLRCLAGIGEGVLYAVSLSIVAAHFRNPDRLYGCFQIVWALGSIALFPIAGELTAAFGHHGVLSLAAGLTLALAPLLLLLPRVRIERGDRAVAAMANAPPLLGVMTFTAIVLYLTASAAIYAFSAPLGERAGLDASAVGYALTIMTLVGLVGAGAATTLNVRWGRTIPITGFCVAFILVQLALCLSRDPIAYVVALVGSGIVYYFSIPYLFGIAAALDRNGRWAAAAGSAYLIGFAAGPIVGGAVIDAAGYGALAAVCILLTVAAWGLAISVIRGLQGRLQIARVDDALA
ncbi:MFS transporter [Ensifer adhaerens]|uniref:MFS transporter n=1 Tax=Ensifer adhaerens TaxID=106592 RepID=UPI003D04011B